MSNYHDFHIPLTPLKVFYNIQQQIYRDILFLMEEKLTLFKNRKRFGIEKNIDIIFKNTALVLSSFVAIILLGIILVVFFQSFESFSRYGLKFLVTSEWNPVKDEYGAFTAIYGTLVTSFLSLLITIPLGVGTAIFITEDFVPKVFREIIGSFVELLAAIPSVVLGLWACLLYTSPSPRD